MPDLSEKLTSRPRGVEVQTPYPVRQQVQQRALHQFELAVSKWNASVVVCPPSAMEARVANIYRAIKNDCAHNTGRRQGTHETIKRRDRIPRTRVAVYHNPVGSTNLRIQPWVKSAVGNSASARPRALHLLGLDPNLLKDVNVPQHGA